MVVICEKRKFLKNKTKVQILVGVVSGVEGRSLLDMVGFSVGFVSVTAGFHGCGWVWVGVGVGGELHTYTLVAVN